MQLVTGADIEARLHVGDIAAYPLLSCSVDAAVDDLKASPMYDRIDHLAVRRRDDGPVIGVLRNFGALPGGSVREHARPLSDTDLVAVDTPLSVYADSAAEHPFRLVLGRNGIEGAVTPSDLNKVPTQLLVFGIITVLEAALLNAIRRSPTSEEAAVRLLPERERDELIDRQERLNRAGLDLDLLDSTDFGQKVRIANGLRIADADYRRLDRIRDRLRNRVAHGRPLVEGPDDVSTLAASLRDARSITTALHDQAHTR